MNKNVIKSKVNKHSKEPIFGFSLIGKTLSKRFHQRPIFVVGLGRSGTSILLQSLGKHKQVLCAQREVPIFPYIGQVAYQITSGPQVEHFQYCCRISVDSFLVQLRRLLFEICWGPNWGALKLLRIWASEPALMYSRRYWVARTFPDSAAAEGLRNIFPSSKFVHIYRNGIDVVSSRMKYDAFKNDSFENHCKLWAESVEKYRYLRSSNYSIAISQEQLLTERKETFDAIIQFLELDQDENPAKFAESTVLIPHDMPREKENLKIKDVFSHFKNRPASHQEWSKEKRTVFRNICGKAMDELGYTIPF